jgi:hypothetical protein
VDNRTSSQLRKIDGKRGERCDVDEVDDGGLKWKVFVMEICGGWKFRLDGSHRAPGGRGLKGGMMEQCWRGEKEGTKRRGWG